MEPTMETTEKRDGRRRKKLGGPGGVVRVYKETWDALQAYCMKTGGRISEVAEEAFQMFLKARTKGGK